MGNLKYNFTILERDKLNGHTYKDLNLSLEVGDNKLSKDITDISAINESINNIFEYIPRQRIVEPEFANTLYYFIEEQINDTTARRIGEVVHEMLSRWEKRISVEKVAITPYPSDNRYSVKILYQVPSLKNGTTYAYETGITRI
jgi:phage baseplate assembly protein W